MQISDVYASDWASPLRCSTLSPLQSLWRQYVFTCEVSRYCILALYNEAKCYHAVSESQLADRIIIRSLTRRWPSIETLLSQCHLFIWSVSLETWLTQIMCVWLEEDYLFQSCAEDTCTSPPIRIFSAHLWPCHQILLRPMVSFNPLNTRLLCYCSVAETTLFYDVIVISYNQTRRSPGLVSEWSP